MKNRMGADRMAAKKKRKYHLKPEAKRRYLRLLWCLGGVLVLLSLIHIYHPVYAHIPGSPVLAKQTSFFHATPIEMRVTPVFIGTTQLVDLNWTKKVTDYTLKIIKSYNYIRFDTIKSDGLGITTANLIPQGTW